MQLKSTNFISFVVTYILFIIFIAILVVRYLIKRYARTEPFWASPLWWGGFFVWNVGCFTSLYVGVATWWWITDENLAEEYNMQYINGGERLSLWLVYTKTLEDPLPRPDIRIVYLQRAIGASIGLSLLYACLMMSVQGTFLALIRMGWGKLRPVTKIFWWILVVVLAVTFGVIVGLGFSILGKQSSADTVLHSGWETVDIFKAVTGFVTLLGLVQISTLSLLIITAATSAFNLYPYLPEHLGFRKIALLFLPGIFSITINIIFLPKGFILFYQVRLDRELLKLMELFFLAYIACLPSIAIARAQFHQRVGNMCL